MINISIEERCSFNTQRLSVSSWTNQVSADNLEVNGIFCLVYPEELNSDHFMQIFEKIPGNWELRNMILLVLFQFLSSIILHGQNLTGIWQGITQF